MPSRAISGRIQGILEATGPLVHFMTTSRWSEQRESLAACDFVLGNPHDGALPGFSEALGQQITPRDKNWFAYKMNEPGSQALVAETLRRTHQMPFEASDIFMTNGAFAALAVALGAVVDSGDEVIFISPPWFFYEALILAQGGQPVRVRCEPQTFDLDLDAIARAVTPRTRGIIVNSPNNPTGRIYPPETLRRLAGLLADASEKNGRTAYLISDESYSRIVYDGCAYHSPTAFYPNSFLAYTYGKTLLTPGQRVGYLALPPSMPDREPMRSALTASQFVTGYAFPNALLQHALADLENLSIDTARLQAKRDHMVRALRAMGYELALPEGTFYLLVKSPIADDRAFVDHLAENDVYCLPGSVFEMPGYFRISLTATEEMIERALPAFAAAIASVPGS